MTAVLMEEKGEQERVAAEQFIAANPPFAGVESVRVELGEDHSGDPSIWLVFRLRPGLEGDEAWVKAFTDYSTRLTLNLLSSGLSRFPYTRLESAV